MLGSGDSSSQRSWNPVSVNSTGEPFSLISYPKPSENLQSISSLSLPSSALKTLTALAALRAVTPHCDTPSCLQSVGEPHSNESTAHRAHRHVCVRHAPSGSSGHCLPMMDAPLLDLADSPSCQQLCKARAERGVGLPSLDIPLCGGSSGAVLLVLDSQGWLGGGRPTILAARAWHV